MRAAAAGARRVAATWRGAPARHQQRAMAKTANGPATRAESAAAPTVATIPFSQIGGPGWWFLLDLVRDPATAFQKIYDQHKGEKVVKVRNPIGGEALVIFDYEDVMHVIRNEGKYPKNMIARHTMLRDYFVDRFGPDSHGAAIQLGGEKWREFRDLYGPGLMTQAAGEYVGPINEAAEFGADQLPAFVQRDADIMIWAQGAAFDMFFSVMFGFHKSVAHPDAKDTNPLYELIPLDGETITLSSRLSNTPALFHPRNAKERLYKGMDRMFELLRPEMEAVFSRPVEEIPHGYFRDLFVDKGIPPEQLMTIIPVFLQAGIATTQALTQWIIVHLARHLDKQERLRQEVKTVLGDRPYDRDAKLPYLEAFIRECHRVTPIAPFLTMRSLEHDLVLPSGHQVPAETQLIFVTLPRASDPEFVEDEPTVFKPERFLAKDKTCPASHRLNKEPFGIGKRICLGKRAAELEVRALVVAMLRRYEIREQPANQPFELKLMPAAVPRPFPKLELRSLTDGAIMASSASK